jgi:hypothetical protein
MDYDSWLKSSHSYVYIHSPDSNLLCCICRSVSHLLPFPFPPFTFPLLSLQHAFHTPDYNSNLRTYLLPRLHWPCPSALSSLSHRSFSSITPGHGTKQPNRSACPHSFILPLGYSSIPFQMVDELVVECLNREAGCEFTCQRQLLAVHMNADCLFTEQPCPDPECTKQARRKDILGDNPLCPHRLVICDNCTAEMRAFELEVSTSAAYLRTNPV